VRSYNSSLSKLSDYKFFEGALKNQNPALNVVPYEPASSLFTDYALAFSFGAGWNKSYLLVMETPRLTWCST
jgi:hypothetical protein